MVFYEAPHRILQTLEDMCRIWGGEREGAIARELTKTHETFLVDTLAGLVERVAEDRNQQRGEIVIVVRGVEQQEMTAEQGEQLRVLAVLLEDLPVKQAAALTAKLTGGNKKQLYQQAVAIRNEGTA